MIHAKGGERHWLCVKCYDVPYSSVLDRRDGECDRHGEVTEVKLRAIPPKRLLPSEAEGAEVSSE